MAYGDTYSRPGLIARVVAAFRAVEPVPAPPARTAVPKVQRRGYEGSSRGRGTEGWRSSATSADAEIGPASQKLRDRMRDLVRNNAVAANAVSVLVNSIVGPGIRPRAKSGNKTLNAKVDKLWAEWAARCDFHGHAGFDGLLGLAVREMIEGGDVFAIRTPAPASMKLAVPIQIELKEADHLDAMRNDRPATGGLVLDGIEYDAAGRRSAYWLFPDHPGGTGYATTQRQAVRLAATAVAHLYERQRVQSRGVPWGAPAMRALRDVDDWQMAELVRKKTEACMVAVVMADDELQTSIAPSVEDADGNRVESFEPGLIAYARGGKSIAFNQPTSTAGVYEWHRVQLHIIAAGFRVPYSLMTGDLSQANFASSRVGLNEFRRMVEVVQWQIVVPMFCQRVWDWFIEAAWKDGRIPVPTVPVEWAPPRFESVNPWQDAQTDLLEVRAGFQTLSQAIAKRGYDFVAQVDELAADTAVLDEAGVILDSDPRRQTKAGAAQAKPGETGQPPGADKPEETEDAPTAAQ